MTGLDEVQTATIHNTFTYAIQLSVTEHDALSTAELVQRWARD